MSQRKEALDNVKRLSEQDDLIVRPLCAKLLAPSKPELEGWIDREKLMDISGRNRQPQLALAKKIGLEDFESPGGGCLLTEIQFSNKLRDFVDYDKLEVEDIDTLKVGRHLRLPDGCKLIIGRNAQDNEKIKATSSKRYLTARILDASGPLCLVEKNSTQDDLKLAVKLILTYGKTQMNQIYKVEMMDSLDITKEYLYEGIKFETKDNAIKYFI
jgi:tRNA-specific 2-thiouridylase